MRLCYTTARMASLRFRRVRCVYNHEFVTPGRNVANAGMSNAKSLYLTVSRDIIDIHEPRVLLQNILSDGALRWSNN